MNNLKQNIVFDFDGVIHKYSKGWQDGSIYDEPNKGIKETIDKLRTVYRVVIVSTRSNTEKGRNEIREWLQKYQIEVDDIVAEKPPALLYIDDRAIKYDPYTISLVNQIIGFKPYQERIKEYENMNPMDLLNLLKLKTTEHQTLNEFFDEKYTTTDANKTIDDMVKSMIITIKLYDDLNECIRKYL